ncbi:hypothetical protein [Thermaerobacillus caldiproteolyticus]|uniref:hypothetical protein n=1 Tax=Thermaerobacillus caldiproteolyticus TaxID=247480 RepID=UPI0018F1FC64|nr:hypothetical protein [Anoxybacillus caldiproteolyticus]
MTESRNSLETFFHYLHHHQLRMETVPLKLQKEYYHPDDDYDFHAYRILLLIRVCGIDKPEFFDNYTIYGRTKFAFYDFLIRYPFYLEKILKIKKKTSLIEALELKPYETEDAFSPMIKYIRGPWDHKYPDILNYMVSKKLINVHFSHFNKTQKAFCITLTNLGLEKSEVIIEEQPIWVKRMEVINAIFRRDTTNQKIEAFIREHFPSLILGNEGE